MAGAPVSSTSTKSSRFWFLSLAALGIVYGDIGTSPIYAVRESFFGQFGVTPNAENVLGVLSLITWSLILIVGIKYHIIVLQADNEGEGGILALTALASSEGEQATFSAGRRLTRGRTALVAIGLFGAALLFGDGMLTPAISVVSAVEGLEVYSPSLASYILPITIIILIGLFSFQRHGTTAIGRAFGPVMLVWFLTLAVLGARGILLDPSVLAAVNPWHAVTYFMHHGWGGFLVLAAVFLAVTGGEALYADLGHFGHGPVQIDWFGFAMWALLINYFGQGALVLARPEVRQPFFELAPSWSLVPLILLTTAATIIASQAVISGVFSLTMQAVTLGYWPRSAVRHTSAAEYGQIYVPGANWALLIGTIVLVLAFRSSSHMAAAYGVAIVCTMLVTTLLLFVVLPEKFSWPRLAAYSVLTVYLLIELAFLGANAVKIHEGGWVSLVIAAVLYLLVTTWQYGRRMLGERLQTMLIPLEAFFADLESTPPIRVPGTAVYLTGNPTKTPPPLVLNLEHQKTLHERVVLLTVNTERVPHVRAVRRVKVEELRLGFYRVTVRYGFMERPNLLRALDYLAAEGLTILVPETTFFLGRERVLAQKAPFLARLRIRLFAVMSRNSQRATAFFNIPSDRVVEVGSQIEV